MNRSNHQYYRPSTRGELRDQLQAGVPCEVATSMANSTKIMLEGWLEFSDFRTRPSENDGWTVFEPGAPVLRITEESSCK